MKGRKENRKPPIWGIKVIDSFHGVYKDNVSWVVMSEENLTRAEIIKDVYNKITVFASKKNAEEAVQILTRGPVVLEHNQYSRQVLACKLPESLRPYAAIPGLPAQAKAKAKESGEYSKKDLKQIAKEEVAKAAAKAGWSHGNLKECRQCGGETPMIDDKGRCEKCLKKEWAGYPEGECASCGEWEPLLEHSCRLCHEALIEFLADLTARGGDTIPSREKAREAAKARLSSKARQGGIL